MKEQLMKEQAPGRQNRLSTLDGPESFSMKPLAVIILGASEARRNVLATALGGAQAHVTKSAALPTRDALAPIIQQQCDVLIVDINEDPERCLELIEAAAGAESSMTVMAYSRLGGPDLIVRCMRAGAREFLSEPLDPGVIAEALIRAAVRREEAQPKKKTAGKCLVFVGAKGGSGVTTIAANFAVALTRESDQKVVLLDLGLRLGDAALALGLSNEFSTVDALENESRLDSDLVSKLLVRHESGLQVMGAPDSPSTFHPTPSGVMTLINILRNDFAWVVVDAGTHYESYGETLFGIADKIYLVSQVSVTELRNSNRLITREFKDQAVRKLDVVLNRYSPSPGEIDQPTIAKALTLSPAWQIPFDNVAVRAAQNAASALISKDGPVTRVLTQMARTACGKPVEELKKKRFGLW
jgi:pilus assembly protein CpaE